MSTALDSVQGEGAENNIPRTLPSLRTRTEVTIRATEHKKVYHTSPHGRKTNSAIRDHIVLKDCYLFPKVRKRGIRF